MKKAAWLILGISLAYGSAFAQQHAKRSPDDLTRVNFERTIQLENDSKAEDVILEIEAGTELFDLMIECSLVAGKLVIEVFDPDGVKQGNFSAATQLDSEKQERVQGRFMKTLNDPMPGNWKVKIVPTSARGSIKMATGYKR